MILYELLLTFPNYHHLALDIYFELYINRKDYWDEGRRGRSGEREREVEQDVEIKNKELTKNATERAREIWVNII